MDIHEAYNILECLESISDEDLRAKYKQLAFQFHPDRCATKDKDKLKQINEAYDTVRDFREHPEKHQQQSPFAGFGVSFEDLFGGVGGQSFSRSSPPPVVPITISFKESVIGAKRQITYRRNAKCAKCNGKGIETIGNGCAKCGGTGTYTQKSPGMMFSTPCDKCRGQGIKQNKCESCKGKAVQEQEVSTGVSIPAGVEHNSMLVMQHAGHYQGQAMFAGESYGGVHINVKVEKDDELKLVGDDVESHLEISLVEALAGCKKNVRTIHGMREVEVKKEAHHLDEIRLDGCGVPNDGVQRVIVEVKYPADIEGLIGYLKKKKEQTNEV